VVSERGRLLPQTVRNGPVAVFRSRDAPWPRTLISHLSLYFITSLPTLREIIKDYSIDIC
jgi:hypothetical protein